MDIRDTRALKATAARRLEQAPAQKRIVLIYTGITLAVTALVTVITYCLDLQISQTSGLSSLGSQSMFSTLQTMLSIAQTLFLMCLDLGYIAAMLRVARGQYASPQTLRLGFDRFWPLLRCTLLQSLIYLGISIVCVYVGIFLFLLTPYAAPVVDLLLPLVTEAAATGQTAIALDEATYFQLVITMAPGLLFSAILILAASAPVSYRFRMANYVLIDRPGTGALAALGESRKMMKGNCLKLFRLDLRLWWYYAALAVSLAVSYCYRLLPLFGVALPWSMDVSYFVFFALYLAMQFGINYCLRNRVEVTYALAYDAVKPPEKKETGVVLGNIFQM